MAEGSTYETVVTWMHTCSLLTYMVSKLILMSRRSVGGGGSGGKGGGKEHSPLKGRNTANEEKG